MQARQTGKGEDGSTHHTVSRAGGESVLCRCGVRQGTNWLVGGRGLLREEYVDYAVAGDSA